MFSMVYVGAGDVPDGSGMGLSKGCCGFLNRKLLLMGPNMLAQCSQCKFTTYGGMVSSYCESYI